MNTTDLAVILKNLDGQLDAMRFSGRSALARTLHGIGHKTIGLYMSALRDGEPMPVNAVIANLINTINMLRRHFDNDNEFRATVSLIADKVLDRPLYNCHIGRDFDPALNAVNEPHPGYNVGDYGPGPGPMPNPFTPMSVEEFFMGSPKTDGAASVEAAQAMYDAADKADVYGPTQPSPRAAPAVPAVPVADLAEAVITAFKALAHADALMQRANGKQG